MRFGIKTPDDVQVRGKTVLCRVDINQPMDREMGTLRSINRIEACVPTIRELSDKGAKVVLLAHQGSDIEYKNYYATKPHAAVLTGLLGREVKWIDDVCGPAARAVVRELQSGEILLLDNVRFVAEEQTLFELKLRLTHEQQAKTLLVEKLAPCMGYEISGALGVKYAIGDRDVYAMTGDGSFIMLHAEMLTALQEHKKSISACSTTPAMAASTIYRWVTATTASAPSCAGAWETRRSPRTSGTWTLTRIIWPTKRTRGSIKTGGDFTMLKIGLIGCGAIGKDHCRRIIETVPGATVVAVSDYAAAAADETAAKYGIRSFGNDCSGMIADPEVEAVVITSIDPTHHDYVMEVLKYEKWCFCEKPLSQNARDCEEIIAREQEIGKRLVQVGFMRRYDRGYAEMKRIIDSGELGAPLLIKACHRNVSQGPGFKTENGVTNVAIHELDICRWVQSIKSGRLTGPSAWDGYVACVARDALNASRGTSRFLKVETIGKPEMYC